MENAHNCPICLSNFREPVCLPCGHLFCRRCIREHVNAATLPNMTCECPTCRKAFHITVPDLTYLPAQYHPFIVHSMRRVYVDVNPQDPALLRKFEDLEKRFATKRRAEEALMRRCEGLKASLDAHRIGEREAVQHAEDLEERLDDAETDFQNYSRETKKRLLTLESENQAYRARQEHMAAQLQVLRNELERSEKRRRELERNISARHAGDSSNESGMMAMPHPDLSREIPRQRVIKPLPKRRVPRTREDDSVTLSMSKRPRTFKTEWEDTPVLVFD